MKLRYCLHKNGHNCLYLRVKVGLWENEIFHNSYKIFWISYFVFGAKVIEKSRTNRVSAGHLKAYALNELCQNQALKDIQKHYF